MAIQQASEHFFFSKEVLQEKNPYSVTRAIIHKQKHRVEDVSIITISRSFCSKGGIIAEELARELGYKFISREILLEASDQYNIPEIKLAKAIHDSPTFLEKFTHEKEKYIAFIRAALLNRLKDGDIVYSGLAGHFFLQDISSVLKVRVLSDMESRIKEETERENISEIVARKQLLHDDKQRYNWSMYLYKMDTSDPELYDLVLNLKNMSVNDCVEIISDTVKLDCFKFSPDARQRLHDSAFAATIKAAIVDKYYDARVTSRSGNVEIFIPDPVSNPDKTKAAIQDIVSGISGVENVHVNVKSSAMPRTAMHKR